MTFPCDFVERSKPFVSLHFDDDVNGIGRMAKKRAAPNRSGTPKQVYLSQEEWDLIEKAAKIFDRGNMSALIIRGAVVEAKRIIKEDSP